MIRVFLARGLFPRGGDGEEPMNPTVSVPIARPAPARQGWGPRRTAMSRQAKSR